MYGWRSQIKSQTQIGYEGELADSHKINKEQVHHTPLILQLLRVFN